MMGRGDFLYTLWSSGALELWSSGAPKGKAGDRKRSCSSDTLTIGLTMMAPCFQGSALHSTHSDSTPSASRNLSPFTDPSETVPSRCWRGSRTKLIPWTVSHRNSPCFANQPPIFPNLVVVVRTGSFRTALLSTVLKRTRG
jgi:hypothetical protein